MRPASVGADGSWITELPYTVVEVNFSACRRVWQRWLCHQWPLLVLELWARCRCVCVCVCVCWCVCLWFRLQRLDYLAQKFKSKCDSHEEWASGKDDMLRNKDYKNCRLNELKVTDWALDSSWNLIGTSITRAPFTRYSLLNELKVTDWALDSSRNLTFITKAPFTRYSLLLNRLSVWFDNWLYRVYKYSTGCQIRLTTSLTTGCIVYTAGCQTRCTTRFDNQLNKQWLFVQHGWTNSGCSFNPVVKPVWQPVWQPAVSCQQTSNRLSNSILDNQFNNRLDVCLHDRASCQTSCITCTGCIV